MSIRPAVSAWAAAVGLLAASTARAEVKVPPPRPRAPAARSAPRDPPSGSRLVFVQLRVHPDSAPRTAATPNRRANPRPELTARRLRAALQTSLRLRLLRPNAWRLAPVDLMSCRSGCRAVQLRVHIAAPVRAEVHVFALPHLRPLGHVRFQIPAPTAAAVVADALVLKAALLLDAAATPPAAPAPAPQGPRGAGPTPEARPRASLGPRPLSTRPRGGLGTAAPPSPTADGTSAAGPPRIERQHVPRSRDHARLFLGAGASLHAGLDQRYTSYGASALVSLRLLGPWRLRLEVGFQGGGQVDSPATRFRALPIGLTTGVQASWRWWTLGLYAGGTALFHWVDLTAWGPNEPLTRQVIGLTGGPTLLAAAGFRPLRWLTVSLGVKFTYLVTRLQTALIPPEGLSATFSAPRALLHPSLEVAFRL